MATPTFVQAGTPQTGGGTQTEAITLTGVSSGNTIVVWYSFGANHTVSITDDKGNSYSNEYYLYDSTNVQGLGGSVAHVTTGGTVIITVDWDSAGSDNPPYTTIFAEEYSGVDSTVVVDNTAVGQLQAAPGTGADGISTGAFTTVTDDCLICACAGNIDGGQIPAVGTVGTSASSDGTYTAMRSEYWAAGTAGSKTSNFTDGGSNNRTISAQIALRPAVTGKTASGSINLTQPVATGSAHRMNISITDVNTSESWSDGDTGIVITGVGFV